MGRTISYNDSAQVTKTTLNDVRETGHSWHDPSNGQVFVYLREQAAIATDGTHITDENGNQLYDVSIAAEIRDVTEANIPTEITNLVDAINTTFPDEWPTVGNSKVTIK